MLVRDESLAGAMWVCLVLVAALPATSRAFEAEYCSSNTLATNTSWLQFTKEPIPLEYALHNSFKSIHCCGKGYRSIEWFKNGAAYPWSANVSNFILYPEAANQTLYAREAARPDGGNYTCRMSNETHSRNHTIRLEVIDKSPDSPKTTFMSPDQWVEAGNSVRLYCEALVGQSYLADAKNELRWLKVWPNGTEGDLLPTQMEIRTSRDDNQDILGAYLVLPMVSSIDYGKYVCSIRNNEVVSKSYVTIHYKAAWWSPAGGGGGPGGAGGVPWRAALWVAAGAAAAALTMAVLHRKCTPRLLLAARVMHARATSSTHISRILEKEYDVMVSYTAVDGALVRGALLSTLALKYNYRVLPLCLSAPDNWYQELSGELHKCHSLVCVVSPTQYTPAQLLVALRQLRALPVPAVVVLLQDLPKQKREAKDSRGESLGSVLRHMRPVPWRHVHDRNFWYSLRLSLPLPALPQNKTIKVESHDAKKSCCGSLDALV